MSNNTNLENNTIKVVRSKRRTISLQINQSAEVIVRAPLRYSQKQIDNFVHINQAWIDKNLTKISAQPRHSPKQFQENETFLYLGQYYLLKTTAEKSNSLYFDNAFLLNTEQLTKAQQLFIHWYKERATELFNKIIAEQALLMGLSYKQMKLSNAKTRWGSCTPAGNIHLSWRLIMAPLEVITYVIVHELAHLKEMNHSVRFWRLVGRFQPDYKKHVIWLRKHGHLLEL